MAKELDKLSVVLQSKETFEQVSQYIPKTQILLAGVSFTLENRSIFCGDVLKQILETCQTKYALFVLDRVQFQPETLTTFVTQAEEHGAALTYSAHYIADELQPLISYQLGSVRDDFNFGALVLIDTVRARDVMATSLMPDNDAAWYGLRLGLTRYSLPYLIKEPLYTILPIAETDQEKQHFSYLDPKKRDYQLAAENVFTEYAKMSGFYLQQVICQEKFEDDFEFEASVIIPVRNRQLTIADAVRSACSQKTNFKFNVIVVDNHSTDETTEILNKLSDKFPQLRHVIPERDDLMIGGCWNLALQNKDCGRFAVQLDSDDIYSDEYTLQKIVDCFYAEKCAAVVGSYKVVNMQLQPLSVGIIDHREWTPENGHNNGLRINGFGAPRAFYTPVARHISFPNVSYGEDYAMMLAITRTHQLARIFDVLYLCRRWEGNSDAGLSIEKANRYNFYKDGLRTNEIQQRINLIHKN